MAKRVIYGKEIIKCKECGSSAERYKANKRKFCCKLCADVYRKKHQEEYPGWSKGKTWEEMYGKKKAIKYKENLAVRSKNLMKKRPDICGKGKKLEERYNKDIAKKMKKQLQDNANKIWREKREYLLETENRFKKGNKPWNTGKKMPKELIERQLKTKEKNHLKKLGIKNGNK